MSRVVRVEVHEHIGALAPIDDQGLPVLPVGSRAEGALAARGVLGLVLALDVDHAVRSPQPSERIGGVGMLEGSLNAHTVHHGALRLHRMIRERVRSGRRIRSRIGVEALSHGGASPPPGR